MWVCKVWLASHYNSPSCNNVQLASLAFTSVKLHLSSTVIMHIIPHFLIRLQMCTYLHIICVCVCVCVREHMCVRVCVRAYVCVRMNTNICVYVWYTYIHMYAHACILKCIILLLRFYLCVSTDIYMDICTYYYVYNYVHTYVFIFTPTYVYMYRYFIVQCAKLY